MCGLVNKAVECGIFKAFKVNDSMSFSILQFADNSIFYVEVSWDNLWAIKAILRSIELKGYQCKVNFHKINFYGVNVPDDFLVGFLLFKLHYFIFTF